MQLPKNCQFASKKLNRNSPSARPSRHIPTTLPSQSHFQNCTELKHEEADSLAARISNIIANVRSCRFAKLTNATSKELWEAVKGKARINNETDRYAHILSSPDIANVFFAAIANAEDYSSDELLELRRVISHEELQKVTNITLTAVDVEPSLRRIRNTAPGYDHIPAWVFRLCSYELTEIIAFIINSTFRSGIVPSN